VIPTINTTNVSNPAPILCAHNAAPTAPAKPKTIVYVSQSNEGRFCGSSVTLVTHLSLVEMVDTIDEGWCAAYLKRGSVQSLAHPTLAAFFGTVTAISAILTGIPRVTAGACRSGEYVKRD
jgi:hypothetical protein